MAVYTSYDVVGVKEDISDIITNISPTATPFMTSIGNEKVTQQLFQWQTDILRAPQGTSAAQPEGYDPVSFITAVPTVMLNNRTQIFIEAVQVSGTTEATSLYGRARESAYQLAKSAAALKRDLETAFVGTAQTAQIGGSGNSAQSLPTLQGADYPYANGSATARWMSGVQELVYQAGGSNEGVCYWQGTTAASWPLTEAANANGFGLLPALQQVFINGGDPNTILVNPANALVVANWAATSGAGRTRFLDNNDAGARKLINVIDIYVSPFGQQKVVNDRFLKGINDLSPTSTTNNTIVYDPDMFAHMTLRPWTRETLAKTGDSLKFMIVGEFSLKCKAPRACAVIVDNGTSTTAMSTGTF
jgi:hypothetical protein